MVVAIRTSGRYPFRVEKRWVPLKSGSNQCSPIPRCRSISPPRGEGQWRLLNKEPPPSFRFSSVSVLSSVDSTSCLGWSGRQALATRRGSGLLIPATKPKPNPLPVTLVRHPRAHRLTVTRLLLCVSVQVRRPPSSTRGPCPRRRRPSYPTSK